MYFQGLMPTRVKKTVAKHEMERRRFNEEINVVQKEMGNYLHYYKDIVIPNIEKELKSFMSQFLNGVLMSRSFLRVFHHI